MSLRSDAGLRQVRVVRDYGIYDRCENPQYYPEATRPRMVVIDRRSSR